MSVTSSDAKTPLRFWRDHHGYSRERIVGQLDPPISTKTLERWEKPGYPVPLWRLRQLARIYRVAVAKLQTDDQAKAAA